MTVTTFSEPADTVKFEPFDLPDDTVIVPLKYPAVGMIETSSRTASGETQSEHTRVLTPSDSAAAADSLPHSFFRVQLSTSQLFGEARRAQVVAEEIFDQPVYLDYEVPYFKVRVGDFTSRAAAEDYQRQAQGIGYSDAWVVSVVIGVREPLPLYPEGSGWLSDDSATGLNPPKAHD